MTPLRAARASGTLALTVGLLAACGGGSDSDATSAADSGEVTITNCDTEVTFPSPATALYVGGDGNLLSMVLALGAQDQVAGVSGLSDTKEALSTAYGEDVVDGLTVATKEYPTMENVIAQKSDVMLAGWGYGYSDEKKLTPDTLEDRGIAGYVLTESCRQGEDGARGTVEPWDALRADMVNLGRITGHEDKATEVNDDIAERLTALQEAPQAEEAPTVFLFDSGTKQAFTSGSFGGPQAIIEAAGAKNATEDVKDTWTEVSWEQVVKADPEYFAFVDYAGQTFEQKVEVLKNNPATKHLDAVKEERFLNLPIPAWTSSPLNINAAEQLRKGLEEHDLVPDSDIKPQHDLQPR